MAIKEIHIRGKTNIVTFTTHDLQFSSSLVEEKKLRDYGYARLGVDAEERRIYIGFEETGAPGLGRFYSQKGRSPRKMIAVGQLYNSYDWIKFLKDTTDKAARQFELHDVDENQTDIYKKFQFYIDLKEMKIIPATQTKVAKKSGVRSKKNETR